MFRIQALISIMQYAQSGRAKVEPPNLVRQVFQAEYVYFLHDDELWGRSHASLYTAIGLLLNPALGVPENGSSLSVLTDIELKSQRRWLSDSWGWQYLTKAPCTRCPSKPLARIQRFWRTKMERDDYIQFLLDNLWIWREIPIDWIETNLDKDEYERNMEPCRFCGRV